MNDHGHLICRCEEVTLGEILDAVRAGARDADAVKRRTRAGMGLCQGKTCGRLVARVIAGELKTEPGSVRPVTPRLPARPVPARLLAATARSIDGERRPQ